MKANVSMYIDIFLTHYLHLENALFIFVVFFLTLLVLL